MSITLASTDVQLVLTNFCQEEKFKQYVREAISTEFFWRDFIKNAQVENTIEKKMENKMSNIKDKMIILVSDKLESYRKSDLPSLVAYEINTQLPDQLTKHLPVYLDNNERMKSIMNTQTNNLCTVLYDSAKTTLDRLTNEAQYHSITTSHLNNMAAMHNISVSNQLAQNENAFNTQFQNHSSKIENELKNMTTKTDKTLEKFESVNAKSDRTNDKILKLERELESFKNWSMIKDSFIGVGIVALSAFVYCNK